MLKRAQRVRGTPSSSPSLSNSSRVSSGHKVATRNKIKIIPENEYLKWRLRALESKFKKIWLI